MMWIQSVAEPEDGEITQAWGRISLILRNHEGFPGDASGKEPACQWGDIRDVGLIPGLERSSEEGHCNPLQCYSL